MKKVAKLLLLAALAVSVASSAALAADVTITNTTGVRMAITLGYTDEATGALTTRGWWHVAPGATSVIAIPADTAQPVCYAAYNKDQYYDRSARKVAATRWISYHNFTYTSDSQPSDPGAWRGKYMLVPESMSLTISAR